MAAGSYKVANELFSSSGINLLGFLRDSKYVCMSLTRKKEEDSYIVIGDINSVDIRISALYSTNSPN